VRCRKVGLHRVDTLMIRHDLVNGRKEGANKLDRGASWKDIELIFTQNCRGETYAPTHTVRS
jgi:hypothetical protein